MYFWLSLNSLCRTGWLEINRDLNVPAVQVLVLKALATMPAKDIFKETNASFRLWENIYKSHITMKLYLEYIKNFQNSTTESKRAK